MTFRDVFFAVVELLAVAALSAAVGVGVAAWAGFVTAGVMFLVYSWLEADR